MALSFGKKGSLGLDIGSRFIKIVELNQGMGKPELVSIAIAPVPVNSIVDGVIRDKSSVVLALKDILKSVQTSIKHVAISLSNNSAIVRRIMVPEMTDSELDEHIIWEAEQYLPPEILEDVHIDYNKINLPSRPGHMDVMLVAAKRSSVKISSETLAQVGLIPKIVDVDSFALLNAFNHNYPAKTGKNLILLNVGNLSTNMVVVRDGQALHAKQFDMGGKHFSEAISKQLGISFEEAETHKVRNSLQDSFPTEFEGIISLVMKEFTTKLKNEVDYFYTYNDDTSIESIYTTGGGSKLPKFNSYLEANTSVKSHRMNVFDKINYDKKVFDQKYIESVMPLASLSVGLSLRQLGTK